MLNDHALGETVDVSVRISKCLHFNNMFWVVLTEKDLKSILTISEALKSSFSAIYVYCVVYGISRVPEGVGTHGACCRKLCQSC